MKRKAIDELIKWKKVNNRNPILLTGAKGVGKTYLAYDFAKAFFEDIFYINFQNEPLLKKVFIADDLNQTCERLQQHFPIKPENTKANRILILDEICYCNEAMKLVNETYLSEIFDYVICISSKPLSYEAISNLSKLTIYPLEFDEFLRATGYEWYIDLIKTHYKNNIKLPDIVHKELLDLHQLYLVIGGMPGSVNEYLNLSSTLNVSEQHKYLIGAYHDLIIKENGESNALKMNQVFDSLPHQLMKDNKKFQYKLIRKGTTHAMYKEAIQELTDIDYVIKCNRISNEQLSNRDYLELIELFDDMENTNFKLYLLDTGLLYSKITVEYEATFLQKRNKAVLENYVAQSLNSKNYPLAFWESESMAKIDFIIYKNKELIPIEIFADLNTRSKSISVFKQKFDFPYAIKISIKNFELSNNVKYVPYYAVFCI